MARTTVGRFIVASSMPKGYGVKKPLDAKALNAILSPAARELSPQEYVEAVQKQKKLGDEFSTVEGISVGLDDIAPHYAARDAIMREAEQKFNKAKTEAEKIKILEETQDKLKAQALDHPGDLALMAKSGGRGNAVQLMKTVSSPVAVSDAEGNVVPWLIKHSYSEGLTPAEAWIAGDEARNAVISGKLDVTVPGEIGKLVSQAMIDQVVTTPDCGTHNGVQVPSTDTRDLVDRYLAKAAAGFPYNTLITGQVADVLAKKTDFVTVRSPMTCALTKGGVCQKCWGLSERGQLHTIGTNIGARASAAMAEPVTQFSLSAKHGTRLAKGKGHELGGVEGIQALINVPKSFSHAATLAKTPGTIKSVEAAPQGGHYIYVDTTQHYTPPDLEVTVSPGQTVEAGDTLSDGIPNPAEVVEHKGIGVGRKYLVDAMHGIYKKAGVDLDKRHLELLAKSHINHVIMEHDPEEEFLTGDVVSFNKIKDRLREHNEEVPLSAAKDKLLADDYLHYTAGTKLTPSVITNLKPHFSSVKVAVNPPTFKPYMAPIAQVPLFQEGWLEKMGHRFLRQSLLEGAQEAQSSKIHSLHFLPSYLLGEIDDHEGGEY